MFYFCFVSAVALCLRVCFDADGLHAAAPGCPARTRHGNQHTSQIQRVAEYSYCCTLHTHAVRYSLIALDTTNCLSSSE